MKMKMKMKISFSGGFDFLYHHTCIPKTFNKDLPFLFLN